MKKKLVILTGAGMSKESGIATFRDMGGMWEEYDISEVATPQAWEKNQELVNKFYNERRKQLFEVKENEAHIALADLDDFFNVDIITQNVDNLHERAGSKNVLHLHGELAKVRSTKDESLIYELNKENSQVKIGDKCEKGSQLRPHIVWFGEAVPEIINAAEIVKKADIFVIIGTSLNVYPAAGLLDYVKKSTEIYLIDPNEVAVNIKNHIKKGAVEGVKILKKIFIERILKEIKKK